MADFVTPMGRLVQGDPLEAQTTDNKGQPLTVKTGPNAGQPRTNYFIAIAIPKTDPGWPAFKAMLDQESRTGYPQLFDPVTGVCRHPRFTQKIADGDGVDNDGKPNSAKEGFAGCWVVKFGSSYAPKLYHKGVLLNDKKAIKRGDYVRVAGNCAPNIGSDVPGLYMNHNGIELMFQGEAITSGPDAGAMFAANAAPQYAPPPGAIVVPAGHGGAAPFPTAGALPTPPGAVAGGLPTPPGATLPTPPGVALPAPPVAAAVTPPAPVYTMTAAAGAFTREQYLQQGYTDDMLIAQGLMTKSAPPPNPGFVAGAVGGLPMPPGTGAAALPAPPVAGPRMTAAANGATREQLIAIGWTDDTLVAAGMMVR